MSTAHVRVPRRQERASCTVRNQSVNDGWWVYVFWWCTEGTVRRQLWWEWGKIEVKTILNY